jgi:competence protein ComEA
MTVDGEFALRDTLARWWRWFGVRRIVTVVLGVPGAALLGWWLLRVPPVAVEATLPFSDAVVLPAPSSIPASTAAVIAEPLIYVHVVGAVVAPGVYALPLGSRGNDALRAAGGALASADLARVNLAAPLTDAVQLFIPQRGEKRPASATTAPHPVASSPTVGEQEGAPPLVVGSGTTIGRVRLNVAGAKELDALPGIGPATAAAIVEHRRRNGPFRTLDDLDAVNGIGPARIAALRDLVVVD